MLDPTLCCPEKWGWERRTSQSCDFHGKVDEHRLTIYVFLIVPSGNQTWQLGNWKSLGMEGII
jgi:hypothetical protein